MLLLLLLRTALILGFFFEIVNACPSTCSCKWKHGKQTANCEDKRLLDIPDGLDPATQVLNFSGNLLRNLTENIFYNKQIINLQRIYLARCQIKIINEHAFKSLTNLVELDLSDNLLQFVPTSAFIDCPSLMKLTLNLNPIKVLKKLSFNHLPYLNTLELRSCALEEIELEAFQGLHSLEWLYLDDNKLKHIPGITTLPQNLKGIELRGNPWQCDCHLRDLYKWLTNFNIPLSIEPTCSSPPRLRDTLLKSIPNSELACLPDVSPTTFYLELVEGKNVSLQCHVHSVPNASVSWWFRGQLLQNNSLLQPGMRLIYYIDEDLDNKRSELYIYNANSDDNGTFICNAENAAGSAQANFTIRIIIKEDPIVIIVAFPFEYLLAIIAVGISVLVITIVLVVLSIVRWRNSKAKLEKRNQAKESLKSDEVSSSPTSKPTPKQVFYSAPPLPLQTEPPPVALAPYSVEQNPDLINGVECRRGVTWVDSEGFPLDYGLPKAPNSGYYRTLPYGRTKRSLATQRACYSQDAEFIRNSFEQYCPDVRYTADGYIPAELPPASLPCCSMQWPSRVPANLHEVKVVKRCVSAQTEEDDSNLATNRRPSENVNLNESPDEGYEGEPTVV